MRWIAFTALALLGITLIVAGHLRQMTFDQTLIRVGDRFLVTKFDGGELRFEWIDETRIVDDPSTVFNEVGLANNFAPWPSQHFRLRRLRYATQRDDGSWRDQRKYCAVMRWEIAILMLTPLLSIGLIKSVTSVRSTRRPASACTRCGYDLRATPERCPECGTSIAKDAVPVGGIR